MLRIQFDSVLMAHDDIESPGPCDREGDWAIESAGQEVGAGEKGD